MVVLQNCHHPCITWHTQPKKNRTKFHLPTRGKSCAIANIQHIWANFVVVDSNGVSINKPIKIFFITSSTHLVNVQGPKTFLCLGDIYKSVQFRPNCKFMWNEKRPNQPHYEMTPFVIFNSKEIEISKHHQQAHEIIKRHCYDISKGNMLT